jgi:hypothetical protein
MENIPKPPSFLEPVDDSFSSNISEAFTGAFRSTVPPAPEFLSPADPTLAEKAGQVGVGTAEGAVTGLTTLGGGLLGGKYGAMAGGALAGPPGAVAGGTLGFLVA